MSLTWTKTEGATVLTVTSNERSNCPLLCQILGSLCYSPVCSVSQRLKNNFGRTQTALGTIQIMIGLFTVAIGAIILSSHPYYNFFTEYWFPVWLGSLFVFFGVMCILAGKFPSPCLVFITGTMNIINTGFAVTAIVMYAVDIGFIVRYYNYHRIGYDDGPGSPREIEKSNATIKRTDALQVLWIGMEITMVILATLQLCVAISACVLAFKAACKKKTADQQDPELYEPLPDETLSNPTA